MTAPHAIGAVTSLVTSCCAAGNLRWTRHNNEGKYITVQMCRTACQVKENS